MVTKSKTTTATPSLATAKPTPVAASEAAIATVPVATADLKIRKKEFVERVAARSGVKPNVIKSVLDSILQEMGDALSANEGLNLPPLGKLSVNRTKQVENAEIMVCKLRRNKPKM